jgi:hypothetical protein
MLRTLYLPGKDSQLRLAHDPVSCVSRPNFQSGEPNRARSCIASKGSNGSTRLLQLSYLGIGDCRANRKSSNFSHIRSSGKCFKRDPNQSINSPADSPTQPSPSSMLMQFLLLEKKETTQRSPLTPFTQYSPICLDLFRSDQDIREIPCQHIFHRHCLNRWYLNTQYRCPLCKAEFLLKDSVEGIQEDLSSIHPAALV